MASSEVAGPWYRRLVVRYTGTLVAVALGSAALVGVPLYALATHQLERELVERLEGTAEVGALLVRPAEGADEAPVLDTLREEADLGAVCLIDERGDVIATAADRGADCRLNADDRAAAVAALRADSTHGTIQTDDHGEPYLFAFAPVGTDRVLAVRGSAPYLRRMQALRALFAGAGTVWVLVVALLGVVGARGLVAPVRRLLEATALLRSGAAPHPPARGAPLELEALELAFSDMASAVRERESHLRALAGAVAHEVRNPVHALRLHLGLLARQVAGRDDVGQRLKTLDGEIDLLEATIEAFLVFARDERPRRADVDLRDLIERWADGAVVEAPSVVVSVDPHLVGRAVANLVRNAREAGAEPTVRAWPGDPLVIEVEDRGPGFPPEILDTALEPFVSRRPGGSGLGLAIVAAVCRAHGGRAEVRSEPGHTVVRMTLGRSLA